jgi:hypothetical protein
MQSARQARSWQAGSGYLQLTVFPSAQMLHQPIRNLQEWKNLGRDLNYKPTDNRVRDRNLVNVAPPQLGEELPKVHRTLLIRSNLLGACEKPLKIRVVPNRIPDGINL